MRIVQQKHEERTKQSHQLVPSESGYGIEISPIQPSLVAQQKLAHIKQCEETVDISDHMERVQKARSTGNHASMDPETKIHGLIK